MKNEIKQEINDLGAKYDKWVSVKYAKPPISYETLCSIPLLVREKGKFYPQFHVAIWNEGCCEWQCGVFTLHNITHWRPIPEFMEGGQNCPASDYCNSADDDKC